MNGGARQHGRELLRHIMNLAVGDHDGSGITVRRNALEGAFECREDTRAIGVWRAAGHGAANAQFRIAECRHRPLKIAECRFCLLAAVADGLTLAVVNDHGKNVGKRLALLAGQERIGQCSDDESQ